MFTCPPVVLCACEAMSPGLPTRMAGALLAYPATNAFDTVEKAVPVCQLGSALRFHPPTISFIQVGMVDPYIRPLPKGKSYTTLPVMTCCWSKSELPRHSR